VMFDQNRSNFQADARTRVTSKKLDFMAFR
jgi:hypothetical protein